MERYPEISDIGGIKTCFWPEKRKKTPDVNAQQPR
jgi:hypothetical protein